MNRWHRTVHIPWLVVSYDTHNWANVGRILIPKPRGKNLSDTLICSRKKCCTRKLIKISTISTRKRQSRGVCIYIYISLLQYTQYNRIKPMMERILRQRSSCRCAVWLGRVHVSDACSTVSTDLYDGIWFWKIVLNRSLIVILWVIGANYKSQYI